MVGSQGYKKGGVYKYSGELAGTVISTNTSATVNYKHCFITYDERGKVMPLTGFVKKANKLF